jgi:hypothetical protein
VLVLVALVSRGWGTWFDHAHFDEWAAVGQSRVLLETGQLPVHMYGPGVTTWAVVPEWLSRQLGLASAGRYLLHRIWEGAIPGTITVVMLWYVVRRLTRSRWAALVAGLLLTCSFAHFEASHYAKADMLALAVLMTPIVAAVRREDRAADREERSVVTAPFAALCGALIGAAVACRPNMMVFVPVWPVYFLLSLRPMAGRAFLRLVLCYCLGAGVGWGLLHLVCLRAVGWSLPTLVAHVVREALVAKYTYATLCDRPWWYYFAPFAHDLPALGVGVPMMVAAGCGLLLGRVERAHRALWHTLMLMAGLYLLFLCSERVRLIRWSSPLAPLMCLFIAVGLHRVHGLIAGRRRRTAAAGGLVAAMLVILLANPVRQMVLFNLSAAQTPTTLTAAKEWLGQQPDGRYRVVGGFGWGSDEDDYPYHCPAAAFGPGFERVMGVLDWVGERVGMRAERPEPAPRPDPEAIIGPVELMRRDRLDYVVVGGWRHDFLGAVPDEYAHDAEIKRRLMAFADQAGRDLHLCARFAPRRAAEWGMTFMGRQQTFEIYALPAADRP